MVQELGDEVSQDGVPEELEPLVVGGAGAPVGQRPPDERGIPELVTEPRLEGVKAYC